MKNEIKKRKEEKKKKKNSHFFMLVLEVDAVSIRYPARVGPRDRSTITPASLQDLKEFEYQFRYVLIS